MTTVKKRANGEGNIRKRKDGRWEGRYTAGHDPATGKAITKNVLGKTQAEVKEKLKAAMEKNVHLDVVRSGKYTVAEWVRLWFDTYSKPAIREQTAYYYNNYIEKHIVPGIGDIKLDKLTTLQIQRFYNELKTSGRVQRYAHIELEDKGLSNRFIRGVHQVLNQAFEQAVSERLIVTNPASGCRLPKIERKEKRVLNAKETTLAAQKQQALRDAFREWIFKDPERRQTLVRQYNEEMNCIRPREYDGSHIVFSGINPEIQLQPHQVNAIAHVLYGGNTLLVHEVGAGKTFEMIAAAMESKRLGLCHKSIFVVPNHLTEQTAAEFLRLYPSANILVTTKKDFEKHRRKKFCARIATGNYDAVIIGHSQFEKIPISMERQERLIQEQIWEITEGIQEVQDSGGERFTVKQLERTKRNLEARLEKLQANHRKDDVVTFEQLGVDMMFVDESDNYKNLFLYTKMRNVAGLSTTDAQKSSDMFAKCRYLDEITNGRGVVFATGTPKESLI